MPDADENIETDEHQDVDTFPREYVEKLRKENKGYRERASTAENLSSELSKQLFTLRVRATDKLADPSDLVYDADLLADDDKLNAAIDDLVSRKPHLKARTVAGPIGQGVTGTKEEPFSLIGRLSQSV